MNTPATLQVLALNSGSSSLKFGLYEMTRSAAGCLLDGEVQAIGQPGASLRYQAFDGRAPQSAGVEAADQEQAVALVGRLLLARPGTAPRAIGHRMVHGGPALTAHCRIDDSTRRALEAATAFAPLHMPPALAVVRLAQEHFPGVPQYACFDTRFHAAMPPVASTLPLPAAQRALGMRRYGFHGLSCESVLRQLGAHVPDRLVIAHLGNGASVTAVSHGVSVDSSMGMTPSGGLVMGTRSGDLDPGVLVYLAREHGFDAAMLETLVDHRSGLLGISGLSGDMRSLHAAAPADPDARLAIDMFCHAARKHIAAMAAVLGGIDMLVFTGGIGENDTQVRDAICGGLGWLVGPARPGCQVRVLPSREDEEIAWATWTLAAG